ncbi:hypothetical protein [Phyllobacterium sp. CL33Tsu]|uniref:hypothetical protein n=1 Tax=Phyllobacterium sp. CL33Tsu TaxID=1798191 RepID=UPI000B887CDD|nr:hypothetical protein [Phyllobacterium sp. CL33Tsu]
MFGFVDDAVLRMSNRGLPALELVEVIGVRGALAAGLGCRISCGAVSPDAVAHSDLGVGLFEGVRATLGALPAAVVGARCVDFMVGAGAVLGDGAGSFDAGDCGWVGGVVAPVVLGGGPRLGAQPLLGARYVGVGSGSFSGAWCHLLLPGGWVFGDGVASLATALAAVRDPVRGLSLWVFFGFLVL